MKPPTTRIATFNVHHCRGTDGIVDVERTASAILQIDADLVALQELDRNVMRSGTVDQPRRLEDLTGMRIHFLPTADFGGGEFGIGLATRVESQIEARLLRPTPFDRRHGLIVARSDRVTLIATHLSRKPNARALEFPQLWSLCRRLGSPKVVAGDLNTDGLALRLLVLAGVKKDPERHPTFPAQDPRRRPDHILASPDLRFVGSTTIDVRASDHLPLVVELAT